MDDKNEGERHEPPAPINSGPLVSFKDLLGVGETAKQFVEIVRRGVGSFGGVLVRWSEGKQKQSEAKGWLELLGSTGLMPDSAELNIGDRTAVRVSFEQQRQQEHREAVAAYAIKEAEALPNDDGQPNARLEAEWVDRFWRLAQDISRDEMQQLWGRILARQASGHTSFSPRTLESIALLTSDEIDQVVRLAPVLTRYRSKEGAQLSGVIYHVRLQSDALSIADNDALKEANSPLFRAWPRGKLDPLAHIGLAEQPEFFSKELRVYPQDGELPITIGQRAFVVSGFLSGPGAAGNDDTKLGAVENVTRLGSEICSLVEAPPNQEYIEALRAALEFNRLQLKPT